MAHRSDRLKQSWCVLAFLCGVNDAAIPYKEELPIDARGTVWVGPTHL